MAKRIFFKDKLSNLYFLHSRESNIYINKFESNEWTRDSLIIENVADDFSVCIDLGNNIHVFSLDFFGNIILSTYKENEWKKNIISKNHISERIPIFIHSVMDEDLHLFFNQTLENKENGIIYLKYGAGKWHTPILIDTFLPIYNDIYQCLQVNELLYLLFYRKDNELGYKEFSLSNVAMSDFFSLCSGASNIMDASYLIFQEGIHMVYIQQALFSTKLFYKYKFDDIVSEEILVWESKNISNCILMGINGILWVFWISQSGLYFSAYDNEKKSFTKANRYQGNLFGNPLICAYKDYSAERQHDIERVYVDRSNIQKILIVNGLMDRIQNNRENLALNQKNMQAIDAQKKDETVEKFKQIQEKEIQMMKIRSELQNKEDEMININQRLQQMIENLHKENAKLKEDLERYKSFNQNKPN